MKRPLGAIWRECIRVTQEVAEIEKVPVTLIRDIFGISSLAIECGDLTVQDRIQKRLDELKSQEPSYFATTALRFLPENDGLTQLIQKSRVPLAESSNAFIVDRLLFNQSWKQLSASPDSSLPPVVNFYSFKGGVGRSTCAALTALLMAREGKKVFLLDLDLEAPGIEDFFFPLGGVETQQLSGGIVDYLLEHKIAGAGYKPNIRDFVLTYANPEIINSGGSLMIVPAGILDQTYIDLLGRVNVPDLARTNEANNPLIALLKNLQEWSPADCIITDCRTGFTDLGGLTLNGLSSLDVLIFKAGERDRRFLPLVLEQMQRFHQPGGDPEALAQRFLILFSMVEIPARKEEQDKFESDLRDFVKTACYEKIFKGFLNYDYPDDLAEDSPLEAVPHDYLMIEYLSDFSRAVLAEDLAGIQARQINSPYDKLVRRILDVKLHRIFAPRSVEKTTAATAETSPVDQLRTEALKAIAKVVASASGEDDFKDAESFKDKFLIRKVYRTMLELRSFIILGRKGAGKSALFQLLRQKDYLQELARHLTMDLSHLSNTTWTIGYVKGKDFPQSWDFLPLREESKDSLVSFWRVFAAFRLAQDSGEAGSELKKLLPDFKACLTHFSEGKVQACVDDFFDHLEDQLKKESAYCCLSYDDLDVGISDESSHRSIFLSALVSFWQTMLGRYQRIKAKIFLREDLWKHEVDTADKSKIRDNMDRVTISWTALDLFRVLVKRLGQMEAIRDYWENAGMWESEWQKMLAEPLGFIPPEDEDKIRQLLESLTGEAMAGGKHGHKKGYVYTWIHKHLADSVGTIRPRQILLLFSAAAEAQEFPQASGGLLEPRSIRTALKQDVSEASVADLKAEYHIEWSRDNLWLPGTFKEFAKVWPVEEDRLRQHLSKYLDTPDMLIIRMLEAGLFRHTTKRGKNFLQVPDIYLYGLGLTRHG